MPETPEATATVQLPDGRHLTITIPASAVAAIVREIDDDWEDAQERNNPAELKELVRRYPGTGLALGGTRYTASLDKRAS